MPPKKKVPKGKPIAPKMCGAICSNEVEKDQVAMCVECKKNKFDVCTEIELITQQVKNGRLGGWGSVMDVFPLRT